MPFQSRNGVRGFFPPNAKYLAYKINGYWFYLDCPSWGRMRDIKTNTLSYRLRAGNSVAKALGFETTSRPKRYLGTSESTVYRDDKRALSNVLNKFIYGR